MSTSRRRVLAAIPTIAAIALGSVLGTGTVLATGSCKGNATEYQLPAEQQALDPLAVYDVNGDGIVCVAIHGKKSVYSDNRI